MNESTTRKPRRLYLDNDVNIYLAERLAAHGYDVLTTLSAGNTAKTNGDQLQFAADEQRAIVTHNSRDFRRLQRQWMAHHKSHFGIIVSSHQPLDELERRALNLLQRINAEDAKDILFSLADFV